MVKKNSNIDTKHQIAPNSVINDTTKIPESINPQTEKKENHFTTVQGKLERNFLKISKKNVEKDIYSENIKIEIEDVKYLVDENEAVKIEDIGKMSTYKLLMVALAKFSETNHIEKEKNRDPQNLKIHISLREYASLLGYNMNDTPKKVDGHLRTVRKKVKKDLNTLYNYSAEWKDDKENHLSSRFLTQKGIKDSIIMIAFAPEYAKYLINTAMTKIPKKLIALDEKKHNAIKIGFKLSHSYNMTQNKVAGRHNKLRVESLLNMTDLPKKDNETVKKVGWINRIKKPFENQLNELIKEGILKSWIYTNKGTNITENDIKYLEFEEWIKLTINFEMIED